MKKNVHSFITQKDGRQDRRINNQTLKGNGSWRMAGTVVASAAINQPHHQI